MKKEFEAQMTSISAEYKMNPGECPKVWLKSLLAFAESIAVQEYKMEPAECPRRWTAMSEIPCTQEYKMDPVSFPEHWGLDIDPKLKKQLLIARYEYLIERTEAEIKLYKSIVAELKKRH